MRAFVMILGAAALLAGPACKKENKTEAAAPPVEAKTAPTAPAEAGAKAQDEAPRMANKMARCPSAVPGANTAVAQTDGAVVVTVTAQGEAKVADVQKRAEHLDKVAAQPEGEIRHTGMGTGGGGRGRCPVVMRDATIAVEKVADGVKVTLTPKDPSRLGELARIATERAAALKEMDDSDGELQQGELNEDEEADEE